MDSPHVDRLGSLKRLTFAVAMAFAGSACDPYVTVKGVVRDPSGAPIQDVAVELETPGRTPDRAKTASDGSYSVGIVGAELAKSSVSYRKDGYLDLHRSVGKDRRTSVPSST